MRKLLIGTVLLLAAGAVFAGGAGEQTQINVELDDTVYISPEASAGTQDTIDIPIAVENAGGNANVIVAYTLEITNPSGTVVWTQSAVDESEDPGFFGRLFQNLGLAQRQTTVSIPESVSWDGSYQASDAGPDDEPVPDGEYTWVLTATLANEDVVETEPRAIVVDNTAPSATASVDNEYFSPNDDGRKDTVTLTQSTSEEDEWVGQFVSGAQTIYDISWSGEADAEFVWDGTNPAGSVVDDGTYTYTLTATDRAGNTGSIDPIEVVLDTAPRPLAIEPVPADSALAFSPNGDGLRDTLDITFGEEASTELLESAVLTATRPDGTEVGSVEIGDDLGGVVSLTGYLDQQQTERAPEGTYLLTVTATYRSGIVSTAGPVEAVLDVTPPRGSVSVDENIFSPEGDGLNDTVVIMHDVSEDASWQGFVYESGGGAVLERFDLGSEVPETFEWNGDNLSGEPVPDGSYSYSLVGTDPAGNQTETNAVRINIDRSETTIDFALSREYFSPNGDGQGDVVVIEPVLSVPSGVESYRFRIADEDGTVYLTGSGEGELPDSFTWDGRSSEGNRLDEGEYFAALDLVYVKGNEPSAVSPAMTIDLTIPQVSLRATNRVLTPDGDGTDETVEFIPFVDPVNEISSYTGRILSLGGREVRRITGESPRGVAFWDGTNESDRPAADGGYIGVLSVEHRNGTIREARTGTIALGDFAGGAPEVVLQLSPQVFSPDGDGTADTVMVVLSVMNQGAVDDWQVDIIGPDGEVFFTYDEGGEPIRSFEWDGYNEAGERVDMATVYDVRYSVTGTNGETATGSEPLTVDFLTEERYGMRKLALPDILFEGFTARFGNWDPEISARNTESLDTIARGMSLFPEVFLELHGHATSLLYDDEELAELEQEQTLIPLSAVRVSAIRQALIDRGVDEERLAAGPAWGAERPLVEFSNESERFQNRRVEVYLDEE